MDHRKQSPSIEPIFVEHVKVPDPNRALVRRIAVVAAEQGSRRLDKAHSRLI
jgi:hypothetical protein